MIHPSSSSKKGLIPTLLALSLGALATPSCSPDSWTEQSATAGASESPDSDQISRAALIVAFERAALSDENLISNDHKLFEDVPIVFHLGQVVSARVGTTSFSLTEQDGTSYLSLNVKSTNHFFPSKSIGIQVESIHQFLAPQGCTYYGISFTDCAQANTNTLGKTLLLPAESAPSMKIDIYADVDLTSMEGTLHRIDIRFRGQSGKRCCLCITGDPKQDKMMMHFERTLYTSADAGDKAEVRVRQM